MTTLEEKKKMLAQLKIDYASVVCVLSKRAISQEYNNLADKIKDEERRLTAVLEKRIIDGVEIEIPACMREHRGQKFHTHDGILYLIERDKKTEKELHPDFVYVKEKEFTWHSYAWIPNGEKFTRLCVRMLGGDTYGDRIFCSATHYKHPSDEWSYMETHVRIDNHFYKPYIEHILEEVVGWTLKHLKKR